MSRRLLSVLLALTCSVHAPAFAAAPAPAPVTVDQRADALFGEGKFLEAAELMAGALLELPENLSNRTRRNDLATGAVNAYKELFKADPTQCTAVTAGLEIADRYLKELVAEYGAPVMESDEYVGMQRLRIELAEAGVRLRCPATAPEPGPPVVPAPAPEPVDAPTPSKSGTRVLAAGIGVSAAVAVGLTIGSVITYLQLRKPDGKYYAAIRTAADGNFGYEAWAPTDMCANGRAQEACQDWASHRRLYYATAALAGVFAVGTAVFAGLLLHRQKRAGKDVALLRRHRAQIGVVPHRGGGASLTADFRF